MSLRIDTESLARATEQIQSVSGENALLASQIISLIGQVELVLGLEPRGMGTLAVMSLRQAANQASVLATGQIGLATSAKTAARAYEQAEQIANSLLEAGRVWLPEGLYSLAGSVSAEGKVGQNLGQAGGLAGNLASLGLSRALFGAATYLDIKLNGKEFARKRVEAKIRELGFGPSILKDLGGWLAHKGQQYGLKRDLAQDSLLVRDLTDGKAASESERQQAKLLEELRSSLSTDADIAQNMHLINSASGLTDDIHQQDGSWMEFDGVFFQLFYDSQGNISAVAAYLPGTDGDSYNPLNGAISSWPQNLYSLDDNPETAIADSSAYLQLLDAGLERLNLPAGLPLTLAGFSQGANVVAVASTNKEFRAKYNLQKLYMEGGSTGAMLLPDDVETTVVRDKNDPVAKLQGHSLEALWGDNVTVIDTDYLATAEGQKISDPGLAETHNTEYYAATVAASVAGQKESPAWKAVAEKTSGQNKVITVDGSTWSPATDPAQASIYRQGSLGLASYDLLENLGDQLDSYPVAKLLPSIPEDFDYYDSYTEHLQPVFEEHPLLTRVVAGGYLSEEKALEEEFVTLDGAQYIPPLYRSDSMPFESSLSAGGTF